MLYICKYKYKYEIPTSNTYAEYNYINVGMIIELIDVYTNINQITCVNLCSELGINIWITLDAFNFIFIEYDRYVGCDNCKHENESHMEHPCKNCGNFSQWEVK